MGVARRFAALATAVVTVALAGCGASAADSDGSVVDWYVVPGPVDSTALAQSCAGPGTTVRVRELPTDADARHTFLVRTLQADPDSIDLLTLDGAAVPELTAAGLVDEPTPWLVDPQLLWFRSVVAERAGLDTTAPITWDSLVAGAARLGVTVQVDDPDGSGLVRWISALMSSVDGAIVDGPGSDATVGLDTPAGQTAASIIQIYRESDVGPGPTPDAVSSFLGSGGGFLVAPASVYADPALRTLIDQIGTVAYPVVAADRSASPASTLVLTQPAGSSVAGSLVDCLTEASAVRQIMVDTGLASIDPAAFEDETLADELPIAPQLEAAVADVSALPETPYWDLIRQAVDETWSPISTVTTDRTPAESQTAVEDALAGRLP